MTQKEFKKAIEPLMKAAESIKALYPTDRIRLDVSADRIEIRVNDHEMSISTTFFAYGGNQFDEEVQNNDIV